MIKTENQETDVHQPVKFSPITNVPQNPQHVPKLLPLLHRTVAMGPLILDKPVMTETKRVETVVQLLVKLKGDTNVKGHHHPVSGVQREWSR